MTPLTTQQEARRRQLHDAKQLVLVTVNAILTLRALQSRLPKPPHLGFWVHINNALFDQAVISWAKLFGSDDEERQPTHWKNVFSDPPPPPKGPDAHVTVKMPDGKRLKVSLWQRER